MVGILGRMKGNVLGTTRRDFFSRYESLAWTFGICKASR